MPKKAQFKILRLIHISTGEGEEKQAVLQPIKADREITSSKDAISYIKENAIEGHLFIVDVKSQVKSEVKKTAVVETVGAPAPAPEPPAQEPAPEPPAPAPAPAEGEEG